MKAQFLRTSMEQRVTIGVEFDEPMRDEFNKLHRMFTSARFTFTRWGSGAPATVVWRQWGEPRVRVFGYNLRKNDEPGAYTDVSGYTVDEHVREALKLAEEKARELLPS